MPLGEGQKVILFLCFLHYRQMELKAEGTRDLSATEQHHHSGRNRGPVQHPTRYPQACGGTLLAPIATVECVHRICSSLKLQIFA